MLTFYLVRHGEKEKVPFDPPLTELGRRQVQVAAEYLKGVTFKAVYASPKLRTRQTAEIIAEPHDLPVKIDQTLIERMEWESNETFDEFIAAWRQTDLDRSYVPTVGDSSVDKGMKMRTFVDSLVEEYHEGNILIVTHGGAIGDLLRNLFGAGTFQEVIDPVTNALHIQISECSVTTIAKEGSDYKLLKLNDCSFFSQEA